MRRIKVAVHVHSEWSYDASWSLPRLVRSFARRGYDAVLMSEHDHGFDEQHWRRYVRACAAASVGPTLLVPGIEYSDGADAVHLPVWGDVPFLGSGHEPLTLLRNAHAEGGFTCFAHPWRKDAWRSFDPEWAPYLSAVEVWNRKYDGWAPRTGALALAHAAAAAPVATLDFHGRRQFFPLSMALDVDGPLSRESVHTALAAGRFETKFLNMDALRFTRGAPARVLSALEQARRRAAHTVRAVRGDRGGGQGTRRRRL